ncbi:MAG: acetyl-CoA carboxylase biotin carboxylase subunit [Candidatus Sericytochromatia bacterium]
MPFHKVLIANRGEIAVRVMRACREQGLATVAVYSEADATAPHVEMADEAVCLGPAPATDSYLHVEALLAAAQRTGAEALHPGYGFLSENADFAQRCREAGLVWIGPDPEAIRRMGHKMAARELAQELGLPVIPGYTGEDQHLDTLQAEAARLGLPLLIKAAAGGGGRGMRLVETPEALAAALASAQREAQQAFGDGTLYLERYLPQVRHIEFQILGDAYGHLLHVCERECSLQRRYQKIMEESPSPVLGPELRERMGAAAVTLGKALAYVGAGTVEFVLDVAQQAFYFLEVNTRLQVEHPVTEAVSGLDLVQWQLRIAQGEALSLEQTDVFQRGHAIECRICAESPEQQFQPATGAVLTWRPPTQSWARLDGGIARGTEVGVHYDSLLAKLIVWGETRAQALARMRAALAETVLLGVPSNLVFLQHLLAQAEVQKGDMHTRFVEAELAPLPPLSEATQAELAVVATLWRWHQGQQGHRPWPGVPAGWRNVPPTTQTQQLEIAGTVLQVDYLCVAADAFRITLGTRSYGVSALHMPDPETLVCTVDGLRRRYTVALQADAQGERLWVHTPALGTHTVRLLPRFVEAEPEDSHGGYRASMPAKILQVLVTLEQRVTAGQPLLILESMKMETTLAAATAGRVSAVWVEAGELVEAGRELLVLEHEEESPQDV